MNGRAGSDHDGEITSRVARWVHDHTIDDERLQRSAGITQMAPFLLARTGAERIAHSPRDASQHKV